MKSENIVVMLVEPVKSMKIAHYERGIIIPYMARQMIFSPSNSRIGSSIVLNLFFFWFNKIRCSVQ